MQVNLDLAPARAAVLFQAIDKGSVVLFGWVEVGVTEHSAIVVGPRLYGCRVLAAPVFQSALLLSAMGIGCDGFGSKRRLKVIGDGDNQVNRPRVGPARHKALLNICR
jgi:hypothetical protein